MDVNFKDNSSKVLSELKKAQRNALTAIGTEAEGFAKENITEAGAVDTGRLRNSVTHKEDGDSTYIGTNVEYAPFIELGTGVYSSDGKGRKEPWFFKDEKGDWHITHGIRPVHFLKRACEEHTKRFKELAEYFLKQDS